MWLRNKNVCSSNFVTSFDMWLRNKNVCSSNFVTSFDMWLRSKNVCSSNFVTSFDMWLRSKNYLQDSPMVPGLCFEYHCQRRPTINCSQMTLNMDAIPWNKHSEHSTPAGNICQKSHSLLYVEPTR
jgi:hypothetical protein